MFKSGTPVIYRKSKHSNRPGPRARSIHPARMGNSYAYFVDKMWVVERIEGDSKVVLRTRRGKIHVIDASHPNLRAANWWERLIYRDRFPALENKSA